MALSFLELVLFFLDTFDVFFELSFIKVYSSSFSSSMMTHSSRVGDLH